MGFPPSVSKDAAMEGLSFSVGNALKSAEANDAAASQVVGYPWKKLFEPFRETTLVARGCDGCDDSAFSWDVDGAALSGRSVTFTATRLGAHAVSLTAKDAVSGLSATVGEVVMAKYVRREIRSLSDVEREKTLAAMKVGQRGGPARAEQTPHAGCAPP